MISTDENVEELFRFIQKGFGEGKGAYELNNKIKKDEGLVNASNLYCKQCGKCCPMQCKNVEVREDLFYCLLHDSSETSYPHGKKLPDFPFDVISDKLDPEIWAKPEICHRFGPYKGLLDILEAQIAKNPMREKLERKYCDGAKLMEEDYKKFVGSKQNENP